MVQKLPTQNFEFLSSPESYINNLDALYEQLETRGFILEVDIEYPKELFDKHIDLPFMPEHYENKLTPNFFDKHNYKIHIQHLRLCLRHVPFNIKM